MCLIESLIASQRAEVMFPPCWFAPFKWLCVWSQQRSGTSENKCPRILSVLHFLVLFWCFQNMFFCMLFSLFWSKCFQTMENAQNEDSQWAVFNIKNRIYKRRREYEHHRLCYGKCNLIFFFFFRKLSVSLHHRTVYVGVNVWMRYRSVTNNRFSLPHPAIGQFSCFSLSLFSLQSSKPHSAPSDLACLAICTALWGI